MLTIIRSKDFEKRYAKNNGGEVCMVCGKTLTSKNHISVRTWLGSEIVSKEELESFYKEDAMKAAAADSGCWLIGSDCAKRIKGIEDYI